MIGPVAVIAAAVSTLALLAAQASQSKAARAKRDSSAARKRADELAREARAAKADAREESDEARKARAALAKAEAELKAERARKAPDEPGTPTQPDGGDELPDHPAPLEDDDTTKPPPAPVPKPAPAVLAPKVAAEQLYQLVSSAIRAGRASSLGDKAHPNETIRGYQTAMRGIVADGIYGPKTRARGKELLGREFPERTPKHAPAPMPPAPKAKPAASKPAAPKVAPLPPPPKVEPGPVVTSSTEERPIVAPPLQRAPLVAAQDLYDFARSVLADGKGYLLGTKAAPSQRVALAQADMGELTADGIYGPKTRTRGAALLGKPFPARV